LVRRFALLGTDVEDFPGDGDVNQGIGTVSFR
jgi:hypothetical protein